MCNMHGPPIGFYQFPTLLINITYVQGPAVVTKGKFAGSSIKSDMDADTTLLGAHTIIICLPDHFQPELA